MIGSTANRGRFSLLNIYNKSLKFEQFHRQLIHGLPYKILNQCLMIDRSTVWLLTLVLSILWFLHKSDVCRLVNTCRIHSLVLMPPNNACVLTALSIIYVKFGNMYGYNLF